MPLIETVTYPDMKTPDEAAEAAQYIRFLARSTGKVRTGIGAAREDVNVSITGGTRVEIKGVAHIAWIPELVHNEAFRQKALLEIKKELIKRLGDMDALPAEFPYLKEIQEKKMRLLAVNLPGFKGILSFFTQPGKMFADEISDRLKVIACLEKPNLVYSEQLEPVLGEDVFAGMRKLLKAADMDAQLLFWAAEADVKTALETIAERCRLAAQGVPNETRKALPDGRTIFERVLPGPDRMYPDTDSAPIPVDEDLIVSVRAALPAEVHYRFGQFMAWNIPADTHSYLLKNNLVPLLEKIVVDFSADARFVAVIFGQNLKNLVGRLPAFRDFGFQRLYELFAFIHEQKLEKDIIKAMLPVIYQHPNMDFQSVLTTINFKKLDREEILASLPFLEEKFQKIMTSKDPQARVRWIVGNVRKIALGNMPMRDVQEQVARGNDHD
jgi:glutamyl-tRNA(Gln) amidotransferase subunit E